MPDNLGLEARESTQEKKPEKSDAVEMYQRQWTDSRYPARARAGFRSAAMPEGEDYFSMMEKHGKPIGPFDKDRQLPYKG